MRKLLLTAFSLSLMLGSVAHATKKGNANCSATKSGSALSNDMKTQAYVASLTQGTKQRTGSTSTGNSSGAR
ncbi:MAG TPA: hypothetical protein DCL41_04460 [Bdellovibrionales bacterium]|nr:hypothetical protein [Pseudobdellovibrionaceae bacterium]HAG91097.1 hypothetical protein [Bdellovibrionales bacterium]